MNTVIYLRQLIERWKRIMDGKYGSSSPYQFIDAAFGIVNLRAFGEYRWKISDPALFINQFVGHLIVAGCCILMSFPQFGQKLLVEGTAAPHFGHVLV